MAANFISSYDDTYRKLYYHLFRSVVDAIGALDAGNPGKAKFILKTAQLSREEKYMNTNLFEPQTYTKEQLAKCMIYDILTWFEEQNIPIDTSSVDLEALYETLIIDEIGEFQETPEDTLNL